MEARAERAAGAMTRRELIDEYFIENRTKLLDLAAFLDRLDRAGDPAPGEDFRMQAFHEALQVLCTDAPSRITQVQMTFSDPTKEPLEKLDQKSARGAYEKRSAIEVDG
jgi:hypothetical protein